MCTVASSEPQERGQPKQAPQPPAADAESKEEPEPQESIVFQGNGSRAELVVSLLLGITLVYLVRLPTYTQHHRSLMLVECPSGNYAFVSRAHTTLVFFSRSSGLAHSIGVHNVVRHWACIQQHNSGRVATENSHSTEKQNHFNPGHSIHVRRVHRQGRLLARSSAFHQQQW